MAALADPCCPSFRRPRAPVSLQLAGRAEAAAPAIGCWRPDVQVIAAGWLSSCDREEYRRGVKQAILVATTDVCFHGFKRRCKGELPADVQEQFALRLRLLLTGAAEFPLPGDAWRRSSPASGPQARHPLVKFGSLLHGKRLRSFSVEGDRLIVYKSSDPDASAQHSFGLAEVEAALESRGGGFGVERPVFEENYSFRVRVNCPGRKSGPMFLYATDLALARHWLRCIRLAKRPTTPKELAALRACLQRCSRQLRRRGWDALVACTQSLAEARTLVKRFEAWGQRAELERGWAKLRAVRTARCKKEQHEASSLETKKLKESPGSLARSKSQQAKDAQEEKRRLERKEKEKIRADQKEAEWLALEKKRQAAKLLRDGLAAASARRPAWARARTAEELREALITQVQSSFRKYRSEAISNRSYALNPSMKSLTQQAQQGLVLGASFETLSCSEALRLCLHPAAFELWRSSPEAQRLEQVAGAEAGPRPGELALQLSESGALLLLSEAGQVEWQHFIPLNRISSAVLHATPASSSSTIRATAGGSGACLALHGPRVAWARRPAPEGGGAVGVADGTELVGALLAGRSVQWLRATLTLKAAHLPSPPGAPQRSRPVAYLLGRRFAGEARSGEDVDYGCSFEAALPLPPGPAALAALDGEELRVDVEWLPAFGDRGGQLAWTASVPLRRLLAPPAGPEAPAPPLASALRAGAARRAWRLALVRAAGGLGAAGGEASLAAELAMEVQTPIVPGPLVAEPTRISPEVLGRGPVASLFCSQRGAWFDPELGPGQLQSTRVADFAEVWVGTLNFRKEDLPPASQLFSYHVEVSCGSAVVSTPAVYRPPPGWARVLLLDSGAVHFKETRLFLPLPPGFWSNPDRPPQVRLSVLRRACQESVVFAYQDLLDASGGHSPKHDPSEKVYHAELSLDGLLLDQPKQDMSVPLGSASLRPPRCEMVGDESMGSSGDGNAVLALSLTLRDRDYVWAQSEATAPGDRLYPLCVGDKAVLCLEEVLASSVQDVERAGEPTERSGDPAAIDVGEVPLREPRWPHEVSTSGLSYDERLIQRRMQACDRPGHMRPLPYKFVLPPSERDFQRNCLPGVFWRVLDTLSEGGRALGEPAERVVVESLSHGARPVACTLLAVYTDGTCDVELSRRFLQEWMDHPKRRYVVPGSVVVLARSDPTRPQVLLKGIPVMQLTAMHSAGFNVYDAASGTVEEAAHSDLCDDGAESGDAVGRRMPGTSARVAAGPLPVDANSAVSQFEWTLHVCTESEEEMHRFVMMLQQCARMDHARQTQGLPEQSPKAISESRRSSMAKAPAVDIPRHALCPGQLEVLLVEARWLRPARDPLPLDSIDAFLAAAMPVEKLGGIFSRPDLNVFVKLRFLQAGKALSIKESTFLTSPTISGSDSPDWSQMEGLQACGGWVFRSPHLSPERMPDLLLELEVCHKDMSQEHLIGSIQLPVTKRGYLVNPAAPFHDLWLPLTSKDPDGTRSVNVSGDIHVMTLWIPTGCEGRRLDRSYAFAHFRSQVRSLPHMGTLRDPLHVAILGLPSRGFDAAAAGPAPRCSLAEAREARAAKLLAAGPLLECWEQRRLLAWRAFRAQLAGQGLGAERLGELRLLWLEAGQTARVRELEALLVGGVPSSWRSRVWPDVVLSARVRARRPGGGLEDYRALLLRGRRRRSPALAQLREDVAAAVAELAAGGGGAGAAAGACAAEGGPAEDKSWQEERRRLSRAGNICTALIAFSWEEEAAGLPSARAVDEGGEGPGGCRAVAYCRALLQIASQMLLPGCMEVPGERDPSAAESEIFWLLFTLVGTRTNGAFRDYFAAAAPTAPAPGGAGPAARAGPAGDVFLLDCALAVHEPELWTRLGALGFQLASVFHGAFASWFAGLLPPASLLALWDGLLAESSNPRAFPHPRHVLIDFAFGVLCGGRGVLLRCCSSLELRSGLLGIFAGLHDPRAATELATGAAGVLWGGPSRSEVLRLWSRGMEAYGRFYDQYERQDAALPALAAALEPGGLSARGAAERLAPRLRALFGGAGREGRSGGLLRGTPPEMPERAPARGQGGLGSLLQLLAASGVPGVARLAGVAGAALTAPEALAPVVPGHVPLVPRPLPCPPGATPEPASLGEDEWVDKITRSFPDVDVDLAKAIYAAFGNVEDGHMSLNELLLGLICHSKGTVGEKASALFDVYSCWEPRLHGQHGFHHIQPVTRLVKALEPNVGGDAELDRFSVATAPPAPEGAGGAALWLRIWTDHPKQGTLVGEVVVSVLGPFLCGTLQQVDPLWFSVWGEPEKEGLPTQSAPARPGPRRPLVGELRLALAWLPRSSGNPHSGQLCLRLYAIRLAAARVAARPLVITAVMLDERLCEQPVPALPPARVVEFRAQPMPRPDGAEEELMHEWAPASEVEHCSVQNLVMRPEFLGRIDQRPNAIHLEAVRALVEAVLRRGRHPLTNRQAALLADAAFGRAGAVPGILDAVLVPGEDLTEFESAAALREMYGKSKKALAEAVWPLLLELERQASLGLGGLDLRGASLKSLNIADPFPGQRKVLWLRFLRAGAGERCNAAFRLGEDGDVLEPVEVPFDLTDAEVRTELPWQMVLTKEEFVSCMLASPLIGDTLRLTASADASSGEQVPLALDAAVCCPAVRPPPGRGVLLELWSSGGGRADAFLGEAWLPRLDELTAERHEISLSLQCSRLSELTGTGLAPCSAAQKAELALPRHCGTIFFSAQWFPPKEVAESPASSSTDRRPLSSIGQLFLKLLRAVNLDVADAEELGAYVRGYALHRTEARPHVSHGLGIALFTSRTCPVETLGAAVGTCCASARWDEELRVAFAAGGRPEVPLELPVLFGSHGHAAAPGAPPPASTLQACSAGHATEVYLSDTIEDFKEKVLQACQEVASNSDHLQGSTRLLSMVNQYKDVSIGKSHVVMVFDPASKPEDAQDQGDSSASAVEMFLAQHKDLSNWQPLDPLLTFAQYAEQYGFGKSTGAFPPLLRIAPLSESLLCQSHHCRRLLQEQQAYETCLEDLNDAWQCFGYACYRHAFDDWSTEWRPCIVHGCPEMTGFSKRCIKVSWPLLPSPSAPPCLIEEASVLLAPSNPVLLGPPLPAHAEVLAHAVDLHARGKSDHEIAEALNFHLCNETLHEASEGEQGSKAQAPPPITASVVRSYLHRNVGEKRRVS